MGLGRTLATTVSRVAVVFHADEDVVPKSLKSRGWMRSDLADVRPGADVVVVRPLNITERAEVADGEGAHQRRLAACRKGIYSINGNRKPAEVTAWLDSIKQANIWYLLGVYILSISNGADAELIQAAYFDDIDDDDDDGDDGTATEGD